MISGDGFCHRGFDYLRVRSQSSSAHLQDGSLVLGVLELGAAGIARAAFFTILHQSAEPKLLEVVAGRAEQLGRVEAELEAGGGVELARQDQPGTVHQCNQQ